MVTGKCQLVTGVCCKNSCFKKINIQVIVSFDIFVRMHIPICLSVCISLIYICFFCVFVYLLALIYFNTNKPNRIDFAWFANMSGTVVAKHVFFTSRLKNSYKIFENFFICFFNFTIFTYSPGNKITIIDNSLLQSGQT